MRVREGVDGKTKKKNKGDVPFFVYVFFFASI